MIGVSIGSRLSVYSSCHRGAGLVQTDATPLETSGLQSSVRHHPPGRVGGEQYGLNFYFTKENKTKSFANDTAWIGTGALVGLYLRVTY